MGLSLETMRIQAHGWAASRGVAPPVAVPGGWRIELGWPDQIRRFMFPDAVPELSAHAAGIAEPYVLLKAAAAPEAVAPLLPAHWDVALSGYVMRTADLPQSNAALPAGYTLQALLDGEAWQVLVHDSAGELAARGRLVLIGDHAVHDRIRTEAAHQRRGLARAVMAALGTIAVRHGASQGLLVATFEGRALYSALGWETLSPYTTAQILAPGA